MYSVNSRAAYLFKKYYNKTASPAEIKELFHLLEKTSDDELISLMREEWGNLQVQQPLFGVSKSMEMLEGIISERVSSEENAIGDNKFGWLLGFRKISVAAAVIIVLGTGLYFFRGSHSKPQEQVVSVPVLNDVPPGGNKALLTLTNGRQIILDSLKNGLILRASNFEINKTADGQLAYHSFDGTDESANEPDLNMISTPRGGEYRVLLPDGSRVWLNAGSSIKFPTVFRGKTREVELRGEAYFEVAKNAQMPFKVKSRHAEIEVLGTHFNVRAYNDEKAMKTTLVEGSVKVRTRNSNATLKPGDQAVLQDYVMQVVHSVDVEEQIAWKNGLFQFKDASLEDVMKQAALWYDLKVTFAGKIPQKQLTGKTSRKANASQFMNMLKYIGVEFKREGKHVTITN